MFRVRDEMKGRAGVISEHAASSNSGAMNGESTPTLSTAASPSSSNLALDNVQNGQNLDDDSVIQWILTVIEIIRHERQRPSLDRVVHKMKIKYNVGEDLVKERIEAAVDSGRIMKIYNQGFLAYNDPVQLRKLSNRAVTVSYILLYKLLLAKPYVALFRSIVRRI